MLNNLRIITIALCAALTTTTISAKTSTLDINEIEHKLSTQEVENSQKGVKKEKTEKDPPLPSFQGGDITDFRYWCASQIEYPEEAREYGISGTVVASFIVERDGSISEITIEKSVHESLDNAVAELISNSPRWTPAKKRRDRVRTIFHLPMIFRLQ